MIRLKYFIFCAGVAIATAVLLSTLADNQEPKFKAPEKTERKKTCEDYSLLDSGDLIYVAPLDVGGLEYRDKEAQ